MKTIYKVNTGGNRMMIRKISAGAEIPSGWFDSQETAKVELKKLQENRKIEYKELLPQARKILKHKEMTLMATIGSLGCDVFTSAEASDDTGLDSWLTLEISLIGKYGSYSFSTEIQI